MGMVKKMQYNLLLLFAMAALILVLANIGLFYSNQVLSDIVAGRQQYLQQSEQLQQQIYLPMINSLIELASKNNDTQIRDLLASQGFIYDQKAAASN
jgi:hypothetical protein